ncbi:MAG: pyridoxal phosphate-dependent decarboxylase family protein [Ilumatobacteraceae bacterium]
MADAENFLGPGRTAPEVLGGLEELRANDVRWRDGRAFSLAYSAGPEVLALSEEAYRRFSGENALNMGAFPSLREMHNQVVSAALHWVHGDADAAGFMTSGGTESLVLVVRAALRRAEREGRQLSSPNMVLPSSAHAALEKGADYFGVESRRVPVGADWRADTEAMIAAVDENTVLLVASAPSYPQGVVDDVPPLAAVAAERRINMHVDACMGGVTLPYMERAGAAVVPWDFRVEGVTSISIDLHKYGYAAKGSGVLLHRNKFLRADQTFVTDNWLGGTYGSSGILGTKSGGPIASSWAVMQHLGDDGYQRLTDAARSTALRIASHVDGHPLLCMRALPDSTLLCIGARDEKRHDVFALADALSARGWYVDRQAPPKSIHLTVNAVHEDVLEQFLADLDSAATESLGGTGRDGSYASVE